MGEKRRDDKKAVGRIAEVLGKSLGDSKMTSVEDEDALAERVEAALSEREERTRKLERQLSTLHEEVGELQAIVKAYEEKFNQIKEPPLLHGYILRVTGLDLGPREVSVANGNQILKVNTGNKEKPELKQGQYVWLHPKTFAIIEASKQFEQGVVAKVVDVMNGKLVVTLGDGFEKKVVEMNPEFLDEVKIGYEVSLLPPTMEILEVRPSNEIRDLFLGEKPNLRYHQIGGLEEVIERIRDVVELPYKEPELFAKIHLKPPKGVLLYGPPGCGKTLIGKAVATENNFTFFNIKVADILSKWVGESENMIKAIFRKARENAPSIIFFDEFDALGTTRGQQDSAGVQKNIIAQILSEMDGIETLKDVYILGATNRPDMIDPALLRPGRFDEVIEIPRPNREAAKKILDIYLTDDLPLQKEYVDQHGGDKKAALQALKERLLSELFDDNKWVEFKLDAEAKEAVKTIKRKDIVSGALLESIVTTGKKNYVKRCLAFPQKDPRREPLGLLPEDLVKAVEEESKEHALVESSVYAKRQRERAQFRPEGVEVM
ncbi:MAG TPA: AAA family ATPase [Candidatus Thermoplasmatota archaeon]|nr:AAA family ATPase [Candidatus Thermoplasmatota archaeon]